MVNSIISQNDSDEMKVLHFVQTFSALSETFIYDLIIELENQGTNNHVVTFRRVNESNRLFSKVSIISFSDRWAPERVARRIKAQILNYAPSYSFWPIQRKKLEDVVTQIKPDVIHSHFGPTGVIMQPICQKYNIPHVVSFHGFDAFQLTKDFFWRKQYKSLISGETKITCVSKFMVNKLKEIFPERMLHIIHVGKNMNHYQFAEPVKKIENWLSVGRLTHKKGHEDTIKAFSEIIEKYPNQKLKIIGEGEGRETLEILIEKSGIKQNIKLMGPLSHDEVKAEMDKSDAFILSSKTAANGDMEGIPTVLMEAQAMGKPCISTLHSGIPEVFPPCSQSFLAKEGDIIDLANKIEMLLALSNDQLKNIVQEGRQYVEKNFNLEIEVKKLRREYRTI